MYPAERLMRAIGHEFPPYLALTQPNQRRIAVMLWRWTSLAHRHAVYSNSIAFTGKEISRIWGDPENMRKTIGGDYFSVLRGDNLAGYSNAYMPFDYMGRALLKTLSDPSPIDLTDEGGKRFRRYSNVILSRAAAEDGAVKHSVWQGIRCADLVPIDREALWQLIASSYQPDLIVSALRLLTLANNRDFPGYIPVTYEQKSSGRIFEVLTNLQNTPRAVRNAALGGYWDYDISNCHFSILRDWGRRSGIDSPSIDNYLREKGPIRERLAVDCNIDVALIKESLIALLYGASRTSSKKHSSIARSMGESAAKRFFGDPFIKSLASDIRRLRKPIVASLPRHRGQVGNALGVYTPAMAGDKRKTDATLLCHALQGVEAQALKAILESHGDKILLPMHDGWVSKTRLNVDELEKLIEKATGFQLRIEEKQLPKSVRPTIDKIHLENPVDIEIHTLNQAVASLEKIFPIPNTSLLPCSSLSLSCRAVWNQPPSVRDHQRKKKAQIKAYLAMENSLNCMQPPAGGR